MFVLDFLGEKESVGTIPQKTQKVHLSMTGFEPAISRFVAERVIRCATWI